MAGRNRALDFTSIKKGFDSNNSKPCYFISHISVDKDFARHVADYLMNYGDVDVYFDEYDSELQQAVEQNDSEKITQYIDKGLESSSHLLCLVSDLTINSWWVPYEIGYAKKAGKKLYALKMKGIVKLPAFLDIVTTISYREFFDIYLLVESMIYNTKPNLPKEHKLYDYLK